ncbi:MAG TPA: GLUG motif-containing protein, partial [Rhizomicrobium sp.]|nr:GLUG motif-containing protein [Rhizomicrobium sp.]
VMSAAHAGGLPNGGHFVSGKGEIGKAAQSLTVKQSSTTGIVDWKGFSIGKHQGVTFDNGSGATLNRVTGGNLSTIAGSLHATGSIYLLNSSGVIVSGSGRVVTGGAFVASSGALSNTAFNDDRRRFGSADAKIVNRGSITAGGEAKLVGSAVEATGTITGSHIHLRATDSDALAGGTITATGSAHHNAHILVIADNGETKITGDLIARNRNGMGGSIETSGAQLSIGGHIDAGKGGTWLVDPNDLRIKFTAAKTIDKALSQGTDVTLRTTKSGTSGPGEITAGPGDIKIDAALSWKTAAKLTIDSYHSIHFNDPVTIKGQGDLNLTINDNGGTGGTFHYNGGSVSFSNVNSSLVINGKDYTLLDSVAEVQAVNDSATSLKGHYALARSLNASSASDWVPIGTDGMGNVTGDGFAGIFDGLGNAISNLTVETGHAGYSGLFGYSSGTIRDIGLIKALATGGWDVGALVGFNNGGNLFWDYTTGEVGSGDRDEQESNMANYGGLVGDNDAGMIEHSFSTAEVGAARREVGQIGGLVGLNVSGTIEDSHASGFIQLGRYVGGLVGINEGGTIVHANSQGLAVRAWIAAGGLVGENELNGTITDSYATGEALSKKYTGGLVGENVAASGASASISDSYASGEANGVGGPTGGLVGFNTGSIQGSHAIGRVANSSKYEGGLVGENDGEISDSFATSGVFDVGSYGGGLVGYNGADGSLKAVYATGEVEGQEEQGGSFNGAFLGGLVGKNAGTIIDAYATGDVRHIKENGGGFVGANTGTIRNSYSTGSVKIGAPNTGAFVGDDIHKHDIANSYWDTTKSGLENLDEGAGNRQNDSGITGKTTIQLQAKLPKGFESSVWAINPQINHGLPYLVALKSSY